MSSYYETEPEYGSLGETWGEAEAYGDSTVYTEAELYGEGEGEGLFEAEAYGGYGEVEPPMSEVEEMDLASELLAVQSEEELDQFLGKAFRGFRGLLRSPAGRALGGLVKNLAKQALPSLGGALGTFVMPGAGSALGSQLGNALASTFEAEAEGLDPEQADFELARKVVQVASTAAQNLAGMPPGTPPGAAAQRAVTAAAQQLVPAIARRPGFARGTRGRSGRWIRRGNVIIVIGA
jgi:hypothetical protein